MLRKAVLQVQPMLLLLLLQAADAQLLWQTDAGVTMAIPPSAPTITPHQRARLDTSISSSAPSDNPPPALYQGILNLHNSYRADHGGLPLTWDGSLAQSAARVASTCNFKHSGLEGVGENLAAVWDTYRPHVSQPANALKNAIDGWYDEVRLYNFSNPGFYQNYAAGHFTQVVWLATERLGCATMFCNGNFQIDPSWVSDPPPKSADMTVCHYAPPGNMIDGGAEVYFKRNVLRKRSKPPPSPSPSPRPARLTGSSLKMGASFSTGTCLFSDNKQFRLCLNAFGEIVVLRGANQKTVLWRNSVPLGSPGNNKLPYTLTLKMDHTVTVTNGAKQLLSMIAVPAAPNSVVTFKLRDDGKAAVLDSAGKCIVAWGNALGSPPGC